MSPPCSNGASAMASNVVTYPRELRRGSEASWRSIGEAADGVLGRVAYRCGVQLREVPILHEEGGERLETSRYAATAE